MRISRLYIDTPLQTGDSIALTGERLNYIANVLRLKPGAQISVFNGQGGEFQASIVSLNKRCGELEIGEFSSNDSESPLSITLAQGISRGERMDFTLQKTTELGVTRIIPIFSERCTVNLKGERLEKRIQHWQGTVSSACEQSGRNRIPEIQVAQQLNDFLKQDNDQCCLLLDPESVDSLSTITAAPSSITVLIGPEGGFSTAERELAYANGYLGIQLGPRVLRTETAAIAAISAMQTLWGDF